MILPKQLQNEDFRLVLIKHKNKAPFEMQWQKIRNYSPKHKRIELHKGNLGIVAGFGGLIIIDVDDISLTADFDKKIKTFSVKTGSGGRHYYFTCNEQFENSYYVLGEKQGELRCKNAQVVCPGSTHPSGNKYKVLNDSPIQNISKKQIRELLGDLLMKKCSVDVSRSGAEWAEVCSMVESGYSYDDVDREMRLMDYTKWIKSNIDYKLHTYCSAVRNWVIQR